MYDACPRMSLVELRGQHFPVYAVCTSRILLSPHKCWYDRHRLLGLALHGSRLNTGRQACATCIFLITESPAYTTVYCFVSPRKKSLFYLICIVLYVLETF